MELIYKNSESTVKPVSIEHGKRTVYIRKNIVETEVGWTYEEAKLTPDEFREYSNYLLSQNAVKGVNDSENISQLINGQQNGDNNQLIIMEAIADLYDVISSIV